jgi:hypothetical protein
MRRYFQFDNWHDCQPSPSSKADNEREGWSAIRESGGRSQDAYRVSLSKQHSLADYSDWLWPAIWMLPEKDTYGAWPLSGEIDVGND